MTHAALAVRGLARLTVLAGVSVLTVLLAALIVRDGVANSMIEAAQAGAPGLAASDPRLWAAAADEALDAARTPRDLARASRLAARALDADATQIGPLRDLGLIAARRGEAVKAATLMALAGRRSPLDGRTHIWLMVRRLASADYADGFTDADDLLRHAPGLLPAITPLLVAVAAPGREALTARLAADPPWRTEFLRALAAQVPDPAVAEAILSALQDTPAKPRREEWGAYFDRRVKDQDYGLAYLAWLKSLPPAALARASAIYDGDFIGLPGAPPFNWRLLDGPGGSADMEAASATAGGGLHAHYDGYGAPRLAEQLLVLPPGVYRLSGQARAPADASAALSWTLACAEAPGQELAQVAAQGGRSPWRGFSAEVHIPQSGCAAQWLRLGASPSDHLRPLDVGYRGLAMTRIE